MGEKINEIRKLIKDFIKKMFVWPVKAGRWAWQVKYPDKGDVDFINMKEDMTKEDLIDHFSQELIKEPGRVRASLGMYGSFFSKKGEDELIAKWFCMDVDNPSTVELVRAKFIPILKKLNIEYIWEYGGKEMDRVHLWIFCEEVDLKILTSFIEILLKMAEIDWRALKLELFPTHKPTNIIRLLGGFHIRAGYANPIEYNGKMGEQPDFVMQSVIACRPVTRMEMINVIAEHAPDEATITYNPKGPIAQLWRQRRAESDNDGRWMPSTNREFRYIPRKDLKVPFDDLPPFLTKLATQCQAINKVMFKIKHFEYLDERGDDVHRAGLYIKGMLDYQLYRLDKSYVAKEATQDFCDWFFSEHRFRDWHSHNWHREPDEETLQKIVPSCETWHRDFGFCDGCPFKNASGLYGPKQFYYADPIRMKIIKEIEWSTNEEVRRSSFEEVKVLVKKSLIRKEAIDIALMSAQGTGKSTLVDDLVAHIKASRSLNGKKILIAVPNGYLAMDHLERLRAHGCHAHVLLSFKNVFKHLKPAFGDCPFGDEIQDRLSVGVKTTPIKRIYCKKCEFNEDCPFFTQYKRLINAAENTDVVICQHAHFRSPESMKIIRNAKFDVFFIDETFIQNIKSYIRCTKQEMQSIHLFPHSEWLMRVLVPWLRGNNENISRTAPKLTIKEMKEIYEVFKKNLTPWNIPDYIRAIEDGHIYDKRTGLFRFHPLPNIPIRVMTDATLQVKILKSILNTDEVEVIGKDRPINVKVYNPRNQIIKVIDGSNSKSSQANAKRMEKILHFVGIKALSEYKDLTILVTVYKDNVEAVTEFFRQCYPTILPRLTVSHMHIGTNMYKETNVQFLLAGIHFNSQQLAFADWEYTNIENHWKSVNDEPETPNPFPKHIKPLGGCPIKQVPVRVKMLIGDKAHYVKFPDLVDIEPLWEKQNAIYQMSVRATQQAIRLRFYDDQVKIVWDWSRRYRPGILFTDVLLENQILGPIEERTEGE